MSDVKNSLERYLVAKFKEIDPSSHRVVGSGCTDYQKGDISNKYCAVESKIHRTHENIIVNYKNEYQKTLNQMPLNSKKFAIVCTQNKYGENFVTLSCEDFFNLMKEAKA